MEMDSRSENYRELWSVGMQSMRRAAEAMPLCIPSRRSSPL